MHAVDQAYEKVMGVHIMEALRQRDLPELSKIIGATFIFCQTSQLICGKVTSLSYDPKENVLRLYVSTPDYYGMEIAYLEHRNDGCVAISPKGKTVGGCFYFL